MPIQKVIEQLDQLKTFHDSLIRLAEQKKQVLVENRVDELSSIVQHEAKLIKQASATEQTWLRAMAEFLKEKGVQPEPTMTVAAIAELADSREQQDRLLRTRDELLANIERLQAYNATNQQLIEQSLAFIQYSLNLLSEPSGDEAFYRHPLRHAKSRSGIFDIKA